MKPNNFVIYILASLIMLQLVISRKVSTEKKQQGGSGKLGQVTGDLIGGGTGKLANLGGDTTGAYLEDEKTIAQAIENVFAYSHLLSHVLAYDQTKTNTVKFANNDMQVLEDAAVDIKSKTTGGINYDGRVIVGKSVKLPNILVIVFRGTDNKCNGIEDARISKTQLTNKAFKTYKDAKVHEGFNNVYLSLRDQLRATVLDKLTKDKGINSILVTGHSLGGAVANLCAVDMDFYYNKGDGKKIMPNGYDFFLVTFGAPRVGDATFAKYVNAIPRLIKNVRVSYDQDIVIQIPLTSDFIHAGTTAVYSPSTPQKWFIGTKNVDNAPRLEVLGLIIEPNGFSTYAENFAATINCDSSKWDLLKAFVKKLPLGAFFKVAYDYIKSDPLTDKTIQTLMIMAAFHSKYKEIFPKDMVDLGNLLENNAIRKKRYNLRITKK